MTIPMSSETGDSGNQEHIFDPALVAHWPLKAGAPEECRSGSRLAAQWLGSMPDSRTTAPWRQQVLWLDGRGRLEVADHHLLHGQEFSLESWVCCREIPTGTMTLAELAGSHGYSWRLRLNRYLQLEFSWRDDEGESQTITSIQMIDLLQPRQWLHVAVVFRNHCFTGQPYIQDYSRACLYCTPRGEKWPREAAYTRGFSTPQITEKPASLSIGSDAGGKDPWLGAMANVALYSRAKLINEFPALGQRPPKKLAVSGSFTAGSVFYPVHKSSHEIVLGCKPFSGSGNYWFYARIEGPTEQLRQPFDFTVLAVPGGGSMLLSMFVSYDRKQWQRLPNGHYSDDRSHGPQGSYSFRHKFNRFPAWLCTFIPYTTEDIDELEQALKGDPRAEVLTPARSVEGRPVRLFKITDPEVPDQHKRLVYLQAGQHSPAEMAPGRVLDRAVRFLVQAAPADSTAGDKSANRKIIAKLLRETIFLVVPIVNIDCCRYGGSGANLNRINTNRDWLARTQPEVAGLMEFLEALDGKGRKLDLALDLHAGGVWKNHTVLAIDEQAAPEAPLPADYFERQRNLLSALEAHTGISRRDARVSTLKTGTFAQALSCRFNSLAVCLEFSHMTCRDLSGAVRPVTQESLESLGPRFIQACRDWLDNN